MAAIVVLTDDEFDRLAPGHPGRDEQWAALYRRCRLDRVRPMNYHVVQDFEGVIYGHSVKLAPPAEHHDGWRYCRIVEADDDVGEGLSDDPQREVDAK